MHDYKNHIDFFWEKYREGTLLEWIDENRLCALHKGGCVMAGVTSSFCPDDDSVPDVIGSDGFDEEFRSKVAKLDTELCGTPPEQQQFAVASSGASGLNPATIEAILRIARFIFEHVWKD